jgi:coproporphyrinogen III oxidase-like Fe-S oxidoreductase
MDSILPAIALGHSPADRIAALTEAGLVLVTDDRLRVTAQGRFVLNAVIAQLAGNLAAV